MGSCYEFAFACNLKPNLSQEVIGTLKYMTRSEDYEFQAQLKNDLFLARYEEWKTIISNTPTYGEEFLSGLCGSIFLDSKLNVRKYVGDDEFYNGFGLLMDWLVSICEPLGFIGYYSEIAGEIGGDPTLIYFENGQVLEKKVGGEFKKLFTSD
jgi:hypothetical protein